MSQAAIDVIGSVENTYAFIYGTKWIFGQVLPIPDSLTDFERWSYSLSNIQLLRSRSGALLTQRFFVFFTKTVATPEWKVEKSFPRWEMNGHSEGYKRAMDQNWGRVAKNGFLGQKPRFWAQKNHLGTLFALFF